MKLFWVLHASDARRWGSVIHIWNSACLRIRLVQLNLDLVDPLQHRDSLKVARVQKGHPGDNLATTWRHPGDNLATPWRHPGDTLATSLRLTAKEEGGENSNHSLCQWFFAWQGSESDLNCSWTPFYLTCDRKWLIIWLLIIICFRIRDNIWWQSILAPHDRYLFST